MEDGGETDERGAIANGASAVAKVPGAGNTRVWRPKAGVSGGAQLVRLTTAGAATRCWQHVETGAAHWRCIARQQAAMSRKAGCGLKGAGVAAHNGTAASNRQSRPVSPVWERETTCPAYHFLS